MSGIKVQQSRFALLNIEDSDSEETRSKSKQQNKTSQQQKNAQKKKNKKKKAQAENQELQQLAFGAPNKHKGHSNSHGHINGSGEPQAAQWQQWQEADEEYAADKFEKDLQQALLLSKLENEQKKTAPSQTSSGNVHKGDGDTSKDKSSKKKKDKPQAMSLDQFNKALDGKKTNADELDAVPSSPSTKTTLPAGPTENKFFDKVDDDVHRILRQEKMQEEYKKQYATESVVTAKYQEQIRKMDKEIEFLRATAKKQEDELKQVKKRNKQLCVILAQGEMKDKAEVLVQVDQLTEVKDELTEQVSELTAELEKERSKTHALKTELDKIKGGKHK